MQPNNADAMLGRVRALLLLGDMTSAKDVLKLAIGQFPNVSAFHVFLGIVLSSEVPGFRQF